MNKLLRKFFAVTVAVLLFAVCAYADENIGEGSVISDNSIQTTYVGDSYYGWSMLNPKGMLLSRDESGTTTMFIDESYNIVGVIVTDIPEEALAELDFDELYEELKLELFGLAGLTIAEKDSENMTIHFQLKEEDSIIDYRVYFKYNRMYMIMCLDSSKDAAVLEIAESFSLEFMKDDCHDFSDIVDGMSVYEHEMLNFRLAMPAGFSEGYSNRPDFVYLSKPVEGTSNISVQIVSKDEAVVSCKEYAEYHLDKYTGSILQDFIDKKSAGEKTYGKLSVYECTACISYDNVSLTRAYIAFEHGAYQYRMTVTLSGKSDDALALIESIMSNSEFGIIDENKIGTVIDIFEMEEEKPSKEIKTYRYGFVVPGNVKYYDYSELWDDDYRYKLGFDMNAVPESFDYKQYTEMVLLSFELQNYTDKKEKKQKYTFVDSGSIKTDSGDAVFEMFVFKDNEEKLTVCILICEKDGFLYEFSFEFEDVFYSEEHINTMNSIVKSFKIYGN